MSNPTFELSCGWGCDKSFYKIYTHFFKIKCVLYELHTCHKYEMHVCKWVCLCVSVCVCVNESCTRPRYDRPLPALTSLRWKITVNQFLAGAKILEMVFSTFYTFYTNHCLHREFSFISQVFFIFKDDYFSFWSLFKS